MTQGSNHKMDPQAENLLYFVLAEDRQDAVNVLGTVEHCFPRGLGHAAAVGGAALRVNALHAVNQPGFVDQVGKATLGPAGARKGGGKTKGEESAFPTFIMETEHVPNIHSIIVPQRGFFGLRSVSADPSPPAEPTIRHQKIVTVPVDESVMQIIDGKDPAGLQAEIEKLCQAHGVEAFDRIGLWMILNASVQANAQSRQGRSIYQIAGDLLNLRPIDDLDLQPIKDLGLTIVGIEHNVGLSTQTYGISPSKLFERPELIEDILIGAVDGLHDLPRFLANLEASGSTVSPDEVRLSVALPCGIVGGHETVNFTAANLDWPHRQFLQLAGAESPSPLNVLIQPKHCSDALITMATGVASAFQMSARSAVETALNVDERVPAAH